MSDPVSSSYIITVIFKSCVCSFFELELKQILLGCFLFEWYNVIKISGIHRMTENLVVKCYDAPFRQIMIPLSFPEISHFHVLTVLYELKALTQFFGLLNEFLLQRNQTKKTRPSFEENPLLTSSPLSSKSAFISFCKFNSISLKLKRQTFDFKSIFSVLKLKFHIIDWHIKTETFQND